MYSDSNAISLVQLACIFRATSSPVEPEPAQLVSRLVPIMPPSGCCPSTGEAAYGTANPAVTALPSYRPIRVIVPNTAAANSQLRLNAAHGLIAPLEGCVQAMQSCRVLTAATSLRRGATNNTTSKTDTGVDVRSIGLPGPGLTGEWVALPGTLPDLGPLLQTVCAC